MMARLQVDVPALARMRNGDAYAEARARCLLCDRAAECLRWLDRSGELDGEPDFCAILDVFNTCRRFPYGEVAVWYCQGSHAPRARAQA